MDNFFQSLYLAKNGIFYAKNTEMISYPDEYNELCFEVEENSFWFRHRNNCIIEMIKNFRF